MRRTIVIATRGPRGYDEVNQARKAGFFGWPLFVGNNYPYHEYDYATGKSGPAFDPNKPINDSRNNTGLKELPPAQPAFIWYPYAASPDFPQVGTGGRNAMAGPVYYTDMFPKETRLPDYYNGKLFIYEWIRGWIKVVTLQPNGDFDKMEPFFSTAKLNSLIDMEVGPDGKLYLLEYGTGWFTKNPDAGLSRIDYNGGNRPPMISGIHVDKTSGVLPFSVKATVDAKDLEKDKVTYTWNFGNGKTQETTTPEVSYTYETPGDYNISVEAKDDKGASAKSSFVNVYAGNEAPTVNIALSGGNKSFYLPGTPVKYDVSVTDKNDTAKFDPANLYVSVDYVADFDKAGEVGHQQGQANISGRILTQTMDCKSCHKETEKSIGPSFMQVSEKYINDPKASTYLGEKIMKGGSGVWGDVAMAAHPNISQTDLQQIVTWVLSLANKTTAKKSLPASGSVIPPAPAPGKGGSSLAAMFSQKPPGVMVLSASYTDKGSNNTKALTGSSAVSLQSNNWSSAGNERMNKFTTFKYNGTNILIFPPGEGWFAIDSIDLTGVRSLNLIAGWQTPPTKGFGFEIRLDKPDGLVLGQGKLPPPVKGQQYGIVNMQVKGVPDNNFHSLYFIYKGSEPISGGIVSVQFNAK